MLLIWEQNASIIGILKEHNAWEVTESILGKILNWTQANSVREFILKIMQTTSYISHQVKCHSVESSAELKIMLHTVWLS